MGLIADAVGQLFNFGFKQADDLIDRHIQAGNYEKAALSFNGYLKQVDEDAKQQMLDQNIDISNFQGTQELTKEILSNSTTAQGYIQELTAQIGARGKILGQSQEMVNASVQKVIDKSIDLGINVPKDPGDPTGERFISPQSTLENVVSTLPQVGSDVVAKGRDIKQVESDISLKKEETMEGIKQTNRIQLESFKDSNRDKSGDDDKWTPQQILNAQKGLRKELSDMYGDTNMMGTTYPFKGWQGYITAITSTAHPRDFANILQAVEELVQEAKGTGDVQGGFEGQVPKKAQTTQQMVKTTKTRVKELSGSSQEEAPASQGAPLEPSSKAESVDQQNANLIAEAIEASMDKSPEQARATIGAAMRQVGKAGLQAAQALLSEAHRKILIKFQK